MSLQSITASFIVWELQLSDSRRICTLFHCTWVSIALEVHSCRFHSIWCVVSWQVQLLLACACVQRFCFTCLHVSFAFHLSPALVELRSRNLSESKTRGLARELEVLTFHSRWKKNSLVGYFRTEVQILTMRVLWLQAIVQSHDRHQVL